MRSPLCAGSPPWSSDMAAPLHSSSSFLGRSAISYAKDLGRAVLARLSPSNDQGSGGTVRRSVVASALTHHLSPAVRDRGHWSRAGLARRLYYVARYQGGQLVGRRTARGYPEFGSGLMVTEGCILGTIEGGQEMRLGDDWTDDGRERCLGRDWTDGGREIRLGHDWTDNGREMRLGRDWTDGDREMRRGHDWTIGGREMHLGRDWTDGG
ncbi:hypothetical protein BHE74_00024584 [Ensete ventricosum]|nr:hypothetical protein BHE74_00024584 [Ensete ventricosum]